MHTQSIDSETLFPDAASIYISMRTLQGGRYIESTTEKNYLGYIRSLSLVFGHLRLEQIHVGNIRHYQQVRLHGLGPFVRSRRPGAPPTSNPTKPQHVNQELCILRAIMRRAQAWTGELEANYEELLEADAEVPRALSPDQQAHWLDVCRQKRRWHVILCYSLVAFDTTMGTNEMRNLRLSDINLDYGIIRVTGKGAKNKYRVREIAIEEQDTIWALRELMERAAAMGSANPYDYLFPFCKGHVCDCKRPMTVQGLKRLWQEVRVASGLLWFRMYDTRHTSITRWAEAGAPIAVIMQRAGHIEPKMSAHYTHISAAVARRVAKFVSDSKKQPTTDWAYVKRMQLA